MISWLLRFLMRALTLQWVCIHQWPLFFVFLTSWLYYIIKVLLQSCLSEVLNASCSWMSVSFSRFENWEVVKALSCTSWFLDYLPKYLDIVVVFCLSCVHSDFGVLYFVNLVPHCKYTFICFINSVGGAFHSVLLKNLIDRFFFLISNTFYSFVSLLNASLFSSTHVANCLICFAEFSISFSTVPFRSWAKSHLFVPLFFFFSSHRMILPENFPYLHLAFCKPVSLGSLVERLWSFGGITLLCFSCPSVSGLRFVPPLVWIYRLVKAWALIALSKEEDAASGGDFCISSVVSPVRQLGGCAYVYFEVMCVRVYLCVGMCPCEVRCP